MSLLTKHKDTKTEQAVITSVDRTSGRVGIYLRNGLSSVATYLYNMEDLRVGLSVVVTKVSGFYVILNELDGSNLRKSYSVPKTFNQEPYCSAEINEKDVETLETDTSVDLTVNGKPFTKYKWSVQGGGYFTNVKNDSVTYNAPSYADEVKITLSLDDGTFCDSLTIIIYTPICTNKILYVTQVMSVSNSQTLGIINPILGMTYRWELIGGGSISKEEGTYTKYTAPDANPNCDANAEIRLYNRFDSLCDTLKIAITTNVGSWASWSLDRKPEEWRSCRQFLGTCVGSIEIWRRSYFLCTGEDTGFYDEATCLDGCEGTWDPEHPCTTTAGLCNYDAMPYDGRTEYQKSAGCCPPQLL